ncbi:hypothetical protein F0562_000649 [Nyssa sinensis]|uniref:Uncharacterized protein n=1 Tax=Nyssa sinensis TaxID=561372 RepID=A0A5J5C0P9_9ASTE|nr:hypothetical protein F0562_000649 [Nyssa sinensis]
MAPQADLKKIGWEGFEELKKIEQRNGRIRRRPPYQEPQPQNGCRYQYQPPCSYQTSRRLGEKGFEELKKIEQRNLKKIGREGFEELKKIEQRIGRIGRLPPYQEPQPQAPGMKEAVIDCNQAAHKYDDCKWHVEQTSRRLGEKGFEELKKIEQRNLKKIGREGFEELKKIEQRNLKIGREGFEELKKIEQRIGRMGGFPHIRNLNLKLPG